MKPVHAVWTRMVQEFFLAYLHQEPIASILFQDSWLQGTCCIGMPRLQKPGPNAGSEDASPVAIQAVCS